MSIFKDGLIRQGASSAAAGGSVYSIDQSIRFDDDTNNYLSKTPSAGADGGKKYTYSFWIKRNTLAKAEYIIHAGSGYAGLNPADYLYFDSSDYFRSWHGTNTLVGTRKLRDIAAWYHIVYAYDSTQSVASDRIKLYINGEREFNFSTASYPSLNATSYFNTNVAHYIGGANSSASRLTSYMADIHFLDGYAYGPEYFGEFKKDTDIWIPIEYTESYGTNGFKIDGRDSSDLGDDESGNGNDYASTNFSADDKVTDTPTNNHGTFNLLEANLRYATTLSNGNKTIRFASGSSGYSGTRLSLFRSNGKAYAEFNLDTIHTHVNADGIVVFVVDDSNDHVSAGGAPVAAYLGSYMGVTGQISQGTVSQGTGSTWNTANARIGVYVDIENGKGWFSKDGTVQTVNGTPNVENGTNPHFTFTAGTTVTVGCGAVHYGTPATFTVKNTADEWATTPTSYTAFSTKAEGEA